MNRNTIDTIFFVVLLILMTAPVWAADIIRAGTVRGP